MNRDEILAKSRAENAAEDERGRLIKLESASVSRCAFFILFCLLKIFVPLGVPTDDLHDKMVGGCRGSGVSFDFERGGAAGQNVHQPAQAFGRRLLAGRNVYLVFGALVARPGVFPRRRDIALYFDTRPEPTFETGLHRSVRTVGLFGLFGGRYLHLEVDVHRVDQQRRDRHQPQERSLDVDRIGRYTGRGLDGAF